MSLKILNTYNCLFKLFERSLCAFPESILTFYLFSIIYPRRHLKEFAFFISSFTAILSCLAHKYKDLRVQVTESNFFKILSENTLLRCGVAFVPNGSL